MSSDTHAQLANFIWSICNLLRGPYKRNEYRKVIPFPEQHAIAVYLDRETVRIDQMITKAEEVIERVREYHSALITAAVTGRIDVQGSVDVES